MKSSFAILTLLLFSLSSVAQQFSFKKLMKQNPELENVLTANKYQAQVIYTQINRDENNHPSFKSFTYKLDSTTYFYPASTVKMPTAFLAMQRLNELEIDKKTPLKIGANRFPQTAVSIDTSAINNLPSIAQYVKKIFTVSDNDAFNRLYEFLGQDYIATELKNKGYNQSKIIHRLVGGYDGIENNYVNPMWFYNEETGTIIYERPGFESAANFDDFGKQKQLIRGKGYLQGDTIIEKPFDFTAKNAVSLQDLHDQLQAVVLPEGVAESSRFNLTENDYDFLYEWLNKLPKDSKHPNYNYQDNYVKFILFGDEDEAFKIPENIKVLSKVGFAYGFLTDVAYVIDKDTGVEFLLAVQLHVNANEVYNDGVYEYDSVGIPFMGQFGKAIYKHELNRKKKYKPNLTKYYKTK